jgi:hypothetical protein
MLSHDDVKLMKFELEEHHRNIPDKELLADIKRVAIKLKRDSVTTRQQNEHGKFSCSTIILRFGSWRVALEKADLQGTKRQMNKSVSKEELFRNLEEVWIKLGRQPKYRNMHEKISKYGATPYTRTFGSWRKALEKFIEYVDVGQGEAISSTNAIKSIEIEQPTKHKTPRNINWRLRFIVMRRDNFKCKNCGRSPATDLKIVLHVDHKISYSKGGETVIDNLQTLCSVCNIGKSDLS